MQYIRTAVVFLSFTCGASWATAIDRTHDQEEIRRAEIDWVNFL
jgi:hypothetical protein